MHTFLSWKQFNALFCHEIYLRVFFGAKKVFVLRLESFCALKFAIRKVQTFWASGFGFVNFLDIVFPDHPHPHAHAHAHAPSLTASSLALAAALLSALFSAAFSRLLRAIVLNFLWTNYYFHCNILHPAQSHTQDFELLRNHHHHYQLSHHQALILKP